jgi:hypothetical protein
MADPYERFARSGHRDLGCKSCHKPTLVGRSRMALTQIVKNPDELEEHATVENSKCEACHVKGDPDKWQQIAQTAGHRVHLESRDTSLQGLQCVECHSSSVHEFAATDKTCAQSGCHESTEIRLGKMSKLTMHCAACHDFRRELAVKEQKADSLMGVLAPKARECLGCHQMRSLVAEQFTGDDPHDAQCALCHNPHEQTTSAQAVKTCANAGCHSPVDSITPLHRGLPAATIAQCTKCHAAHKFTAKATTCTGCHQPKDTGAGGFNHSRHTKVTCESCHTNEPKHGTVNAAARQCQSCHHKAETAATTTCATCHTRDEYAARNYPTSQRMAMSTGAKTRNLPFDHRKHEKTACTQCHTDPLTRSAKNVQCTACHADHHKPTVTCNACHAATRTGKHTVNVHVGCSSCHTKMPFTGVPKTRQVCLTCHQNMTNHRPAGVCADCHRLPAARS